MSAFPWHVPALERLLADREHMPHALLVHGAAGIGKTEFARALAKGVLCESPVRGVACEQCPSCHWFSQGNHPDFREIIPEASAEEDEATEAEPAKAEKPRSLVIKIDQIRAVADFITLSTHRAGFKVLLIWPAEALQPAAANALLKTLEEPPARTLIVLVSDRPARLLATIRSRCRLLPLPLPPRLEALAWLERQQVPAPEVALAIAGGAPLLARDLAQPEEMELRQRLLAELARPSGADPLAFAATVDKGSVERIIHWLQTWVYDIASARLSGVVRHNTDYSPAILARAQSADLQALFALDRELAGARRLASHPLNPRLLVEHFLITYNRAARGRGAA